MEPTQRAFDTFAQMLLTYQIADLAPYDRSPKPPLHRFFGGLYAEKQADPGAYRIPAPPFVTFFSRVTLTPEETARHEVLKSTMIRLRNALNAYVEFLRDLGLASEADGPDLHLPRAALDRLAGNLTLKTRNRSPLATMERNGLVFSGEDPVVVANRVYPGMPAELAVFSMACARLKPYDFYFFRRCDLGVFDGKTQPDVAAAVRAVPQPFRADVAETDLRLRQMGFKRELFVAGCGSTYALRYNKRSNTVVYWVHILEGWHPDLSHLLYWKWKTDLTPRLFNRLEQIAPGLGERVFAELKACTRCYPGDCMDRTPIEWKGFQKVVCKNSGWNRIGYEPEDYARLLTVLGALNELL
ncbi:MAG: hypothetical protein EHM21_00820 [Chloroflexi bacterium]|nr:MAG: hypothetical protein EHM21_00820 [Chloroflexota bacterium]